MAMVVSATQYLKSVIDILMEYEETQDSTKWTVTQTLIVGGSALVGALLGECNHVIIGLVTRKSNGDVVDILSIIPCDLYPDFNVRFRTLAYIINPTI